jgi:hypothetical protein
MPSAWQSITRGVRTVSRDSAVRPQRSIRQLDYRSETRHYHYFMRTRGRAPVYFVLTPPMGE